MALIQIRDVPEDVYETIRRRARRDGTSIQGYMLARITEIGRSPDRAEVIASVEKELGDSSTLEIDTDQLLADVRSGRPA